jgi:hypothetical protein
VTTISDDFNRANGAVGSAWVEIGGGTFWQVVSNKAQWTGTSTGDFTDYNTTLGDDHWVQVDITGINSGYCVIHARSTSIGSTCYQAFLVPGASTAEIGRNAGYGYTMVAQNTSFSHGDAHTLRLECQGSSIRFYVDGGLAVSATNTVIPTNPYVGLNTNTSSALWDNFQASDVFVPPDVNLVVQDGAQAHSAENIMFPVTPGLRVIVRSGLQLA